MPHEHSLPAAKRLRTVGSPASVIYRVGRPLDPFEPPPWDLALPDGTFGNRFDDPGATAGIPPERRFRMVYCATQRACAFGETLARFRPALGLLEGLAEIEDDEPLVPERFVIPADWRARRRLGRTTLAQTLRFVDVGDAHNLQAFRGALAAKAHQLGLEDIDLSAVTGSHRALTQHLARHVYEQRDADGRPLYAGLRYMSRLNTEWECWAIFDTRMRHRPAMPENIAPDDPGLLEVAELFDFEIETMAGVLLRRR